MRTQESLEDADATAIALNFHLKIFAGSVMVAITILAGSAAWQWIVG